MEKLNDDVTATKYLNQSDINRENATPEDTRNISSRWSRVKEIVIQLQEIPWETWKEKSTRNRG